MKRFPKHAPLIICLLLLGLAAFAFLKKTDSPETAKSEQENPRLRPLPALAEMNFPNRELVREPKARPERGENQTLLYAQPEILEREFSPGKLFSGRFLELLPDKEPGPLSRNEHTLSVVDTSFDREQLLEFIASDAEIIRLPLGPGTTVDVKITQVLSRGDNTITIQGKDANNPEGDLLMVFHDGAVFGTMAFYDSNTHFEYGSSGDGNIAIRRLDPSSFTAPCAEPNASADDATGTEEPGDTNTSQDPEASAESTAADIVIDYVVGYGIEARQAEGGTAAMEARIIAAVDRTNLAFSNSGLGGEVELAVLATVEDPFYNFPGANSGSMAARNIDGSDPDELENLNRESDGVLDTITDLKNSLGADGSALVVSNADGSAGIAYRPGKAMIVARTYMTSTRITFVHELGHNIGLNHSWGDAASSAGTNASNYGWRFRTSGGSKVRTVMAYDWSWTRIPHFSDPDILYQGSVTGAVNGFDVTTSATADQRYALGGDAELRVGEDPNSALLVGFNGTNPNLGARNADYIRNNAAALANRANRPAPVLLVEETPGTPLLADGTALSFSRESIGNPETKTLTISNTGNAPIESLQVEIQSDESNDFSLTAPPVTSLAAGASTTFNISFTPSITAKTSAVVTVSDTGTSGVSLALSIAGAVRSGFASEDFINNLGQWSDGSGDISWTRTTSGTPSSSTGPSQGSSGSAFIFTEASSPNFEKTAEIQATFDLSSKINTQLNFNYHMYGRSMGTLSVDVFDGSWTNDVWTLSGQQQFSNGAAWLEANVDLSEYDGRAGVIIRFRGLTGSNYTSDMAIDDISMSAAEVVSEPSYDDWAASQSLTGNDAEPDATPQGDGVKNLLKYAFNMPVELNDSGELTPGTGTSGLPSVSTGDGDRIKIEYVRKSSAPDLIYKVEFSSDLSGESRQISPGIEQSVTAIDEEWERVVVEDIMGADESAKRFGRVVVEATNADE